MTISSETVDERIARLESMGEIDPACKACQVHFYPSYRTGHFDVFAPNHKASDRCESGKRPHCTCDVCF